MWLSEDRPGAGAGGRVWTQSRLKASSFGHSSTENAGGSNRARFAPRERHSDSRQRAAALIPDAWFDRVLLVSRTYQ